MISFLKVHCVAKLAVSVCTSGYKCVPEECHYCLMRLTLHLVLYLCGTLFFVTREGHRCTGAADNDLTRIHGHERKEVVREWRELHNKDLHNLYYQQITGSIIGSGYFSRYTDSLSVGRCRDRIPVGKRFCETCPDRPWGAPCLLYNGHRVFPGGKAAGAWR